MSFQVTHDVSKEWQLFLFTYSFPLNETPTQKFHYRREPKRDVSSHHPVVCHLSKQNADEDETTSVGKVFGIAD
ncbi:hypothetical protein HanIR_Chr05g0233861 [Helianthus annuus]|nr:hypothetical protein HanIR_Chr05g0233861 [Helianthus annuus]